MAPRRPRALRKLPVQQALALEPRPKTRAKGAGRKPNVPNQPGMSHKTRPVLSAKHPVHVTLRVHPLVPNLRRNALLVPLTDALRAGSNRLGLRLCHYVIMGNHLHLIVEAQDARALSRGLQGLCIRLARRVNRVTAHEGRVFGDRYHAHILRTPTETHRALAYVLLNHRKHAAEQHAAGVHAARRGLDAFSSGAWFHGWDVPARARTGDPPVVPPQQWLLREGWKKVGTISPH
jgi:REP element-mobilizing transposase RayT